MMKTRYKLLFWLTLFMTQTLAFASTPPEPIHTVVLIRHAERTVSDDLSPAGTMRAEYLAKMWKDETVNKIYSTDYRRTQLTVTPLAKDKALPITLYDSNEELLNFLKEDFKQLEPQKIVIVGHSNTLAELVYSLGGPSLADIPESEFDHLYVLSKSIDKVGFIHLHYFLNPN